MIVLIILIFILLLFIIVFSCLVAQRLTYPKICIPDENLDRELELSGISREQWENSLNRENFELESSFGYKLSATFIPKKNGTSFSDGRERVAVIVHGWRGCSLNSLKQAQLFRELGFNCLIYSHRGHGLSGKASTSMGYYEAIDLKTMCDWVFKRFPDNPVVGTHGESMGGATVVMNAPLDKRLSFVIEDCGYSSLKSQMVNTIRNMHLPAIIFLPFINLIFKCICGIRVSEVNPKDQISECEELPVMFIHGDSDNFVSTNEVYKLYEAKPGIKTLKIYKDTRHAESILIHREEYIQDVTNFLKENGIIEK